MTTERGVTHATFTLERHYDAPPARVFAAWADPAAKSRWFAGAEADTDTGLALDFRVGGTERVANTPHEGGPRYTYEAVFQNIVPDERIVLTNRMHADADPISVSLVSVQFAADGDGTLLTLTDHGAYLDGLDRPDFREGGVRAQLEALAKELG